MGGDAQSKEYLRRRAIDVVDDPRYCLGGSGERYSTRKARTYTPKGQEVDVFASEETSAQALAIVQGLLALKTLLE